MQRICESLEIQAREALQCCKQSSADTVPTGMWDSEDRAQKVSDGNKASSGTGLKAIHVTFWQRICLHFV
jgi:hypothetical protein